MISDIYAKLKTVGVPVAYRAFKKPQYPPFIVYYQENETQDGYDEKNVIGNGVIIVELYTDKKDLSMESAMDKLFQEYPIQKYETYIDSEKLYQIMYQIGYTEKI